MKRFPWITLGLATLCAAMAFLPATALEYDRIRVGEGEAWRLLTGQTVHWTARMAVFDLGMLLGFLTKSVFEGFSGQTLFAGPLPQGVRVVPLVHLLGGLGGLAAGWGARGSERGGDDALEVQRRILR